MIAFRRRAVAIAARIFAPSAGYAQPAALFVAQQPERQCAGDHLPDEIADIEIRTVEDVVLAEGVGRPVGRVKPFVDDDPQGVGDILKTADAFSRDGHFDQPVDLQSPVDPPQIQLGVSRLRKAERRKRGHNDVLVERHRAPRNQ